MTIADVLFKITNNLEAQGKFLDNEEFTRPLQLLHDAAEKVAKAWCGSWLGYHSRVYYADLKEPPSGARFSQEWGLMKDPFAGDTVGRWKEYRFDDVLSAIKEYVGSPDTNEQERLSSSAEEEFDKAKSQILSLVSIILDTRKNDQYLSDIAEDIKKMKVSDANDFIEAVRPKGRIVSRDMPAIQSGLHTPPHMSVISQVYAIYSPFISCKKLSQLSYRAASHIQNVSSHIQNIGKQNIQSEQVGKNVFIGHGQSLLWRELKDFIQDRMHLPWDEFNRVPAAGFTTITRLSQMLDKAAIAFLIMTAEDDQADGKQHARQNVIHEAGLFQGRLGFERAIILLEKGCEEFSNIQGLGQIRFPSGNIKAIFEDIRHVLEREGIVDEK